MYSALYCQKAVLKLVKIISVCIKILYSVFLSLLVYLFSWFDLIVNVKLIDTPAINMAYWSKIGMDILRKKPHMLWKHPASLPYHSYMVSKITLFQTNREGKNNCHTLSIDVFRCWFQLWPYIIDSDPAGWIIPLGFLLDHCHFRCLKTRSDLADPTSSPWCILEVQ